jgi:hypothetical protein
VILTILILGVITLALIALGTWGAVIIATSTWLASDEDTSDSRFDAACKEMFPASEQIGARCEKQSRRSQSTG